MKNNQQHAWDSCNELVSQLRDLRDRMSAAKRKPTLEEMQIEVAALQMDFNACITKAAEMKAMVCAAVVTSGVRETSDEIPPRLVPAFPDHPVAPPPPHYQEGINA